MRMNVYAEEITDEVDLVTKEMEDGRTFYAVRLYLDSPPSLHHSAGDDDRSGITLWVPWTAREGTQPGIVRQALQNLLKALEQVPEDWTCGYCLEDDHESCPITMGCGCTGQAERTCACYEYGHR